MEKGVDLHSRRRSELPHEQLVEIFSRLQILDYKGIRIRMVEHSGQKWMVFADVCKALGYKNPNHQSKYLTSGEKCRLDIGLKNTLAICISEPGLHFFTMLANKASATEFYNWAILGGSAGFLPSPSLAGVSPGTLAPGASLGGSAGFLPSPSLAGVSPVVLVYGCS